MFAFIFVSLHILLHYQALQNYDLHYECGILPFDAIVRLVVAPCN